MVGDSVVGASVVVVGASVVVVGAAVVVVGARVVVVGASDGDSVGAEVGTGGFTFAGPTVGFDVRSELNVGDLVGAALPISNVNEAFTAAACLHKSPEHTVAAEH